MCEAPGSDCNFRRRQRRQRRCTQRSGAALRKCFWCVVGEQKYRKIGVILALRRHLSVPFLDFGSSARCVTDLFTLMNTVCLWLLRTCHRRKRILRAHMCNVNYCKIVVCAESSNNNSNSLVQGDAWMDGWMTHSAASQCSPSTCQPAS